jgi:hypothetical protein
VDINGTDRLKGCCNVCPPALWQTLSYMETKDIYIFKLQPEILSHKPENQAYDGLYLELVD